VAESVRKELRSLAPRARWTASDWALHTAALHVDLARLRRFADAEPGGLNPWLAAADAVLAELLTPCPDAAAHAQSVAGFAEVRRHLLAAMDRSDGPCTCP
jgi:hypothetical protein